MALDGPIIEDLDPRLGQFGELLGLLAPKTKDTYTLRPEWFENPIEPLMSIVKDHPEELLKVILSFLGDPEPSHMKGDAGEEWYPIEYPKDGKQVPTGISLVASTDGPSGRVSLGVAYDPFEGDGKTRDLSVVLFVQFPIIDLVTREFLLGQDADPIQLKLELRAADGTPFSAANGSLKLTGLEIVGDLFTDKLPEVQFLLKDLVLGGAEVHDMDVVELVKDPTTLLGEVLKALLILALNAATDAAADGKTPEEQKKIQAMELGVLWLLGLPSRKGEASKIPGVDWSKLVGDGFGTEWERWFHGIVSDAGVLRQWLLGIYCMAEGVDVYTSSDEIKGDGTAADPFLVPVYDGGTTGPSFHLTLVVDAGPPVSLILGARMTAPTKHIENLDFEFAGKATLAELTLGGAADGPKVEPSFEISAAAHRPDGGVLFDYADTDPKYSISPNSLIVGLRKGAGDTEPAPFGDFTQQDGKSLSLVDMLTRGLSKENLLTALNDKLQDDATWKAVFDKLMPKNSGLTYDKGVFDYALTTTINDRTVTIALSGGLHDTTGISVAADLGMTADPLKLRLKAGAVMADVTHPTPPVFTFAAVAGGGEVDVKGKVKVPLPALTAALDETETFTLIASMPIKGFDDPATLGLVPLTGFGGFAEKDIVPLISTVVLDTTVVKTWLESPVTASVEECSWASILLDWGFFVTPESTQVVEGAEPGAGPTLRLPTLPDHAIDVQKLLALRPVPLLKAAISQYVRGIDEVLLYKIGKDDGLYLTHDKADAKTKAPERFGLRVAMQDIVVSGKTKEGEPEKTQVILQLGKWMSELNDDKKKNDKAEAEAPEGTGDAAKGKAAKTSKDGVGKETDEKNWLTKTWGKTEPGPPKRGVYLNLIEVENDTPSFGPGLKLVSVGIDVEGTEKKPLFDIKGYKARGIQARTYFDEVNRPIRVGGGVRIDNASLPLGPSQKPGAGTPNPVAAGLLSSGEKVAKTGDGKKVAKGDPVNPEFGVQIAYTYALDAEILNDDPKAGGKVWIPVEKSYGPMFCRKVGLGINSTPDLLVGFDGSVELGPLGIDLMNLSVGVPLRNPTEFRDYSFDLQGLDLTFQGGPVEISGAFLEIKPPKTDPDTPIQYTGAALLKTEVFSLSGFGSYASIDGAPSMFVFAVLDKDLGGPVFFHVTALAAGFGFKRRLVLPSMDDVQEFPLVKAIVDPGYIANSQDPMDALQKLSAAIPPDPAAYWLAAGVRFRSFEQIETVALLAITFGSEFTVSVLGLSTVSVPANLKPSENPIAYAELALRAEFNPAVGVLSVEGRLTPNSYILDKACKLTGGFAFYTWFSGDHEGDFVITLGGYHPRFVRPEYYPIVPRLGLDWKKGDLRVTGEIYFALTPSCLMAGGRLSAVYDIGWAKAWFVAYADFIISWKPFFYDIALGVSIGASATVRINLGLFKVSMTFKFELGADLHIWGPDMAGKARIKFYVVSFTVSFGANTDPKPDPISWDDFAKSFLPAANAVNTVVYSGGMIREWDDKASGQKIPILNAHELALNVQTKAPCTDVAWMGQRVPGGDSHKSKLGISPMYAKSVETPLDVQFARKSSGLGAAEAVEISRDLFDAKLVNKGFPDAMWGKGAPDTKTPTAKVLDNVPAGVAVTLSDKGKQSQVRHGLEAMEIAVFAYEPISKHIYWGDVQIPPDIKSKGSQTFAELIVSDKRDAIMDVLTAITPHPLNKSDLTQTADQAETIYQSEPTYANLGQRLPGER